MSDQPANIAREAKGVHQSLKELLKTREPFDKEVDFQRKNLRRRYLNLLFAHPRAKESKDVETHLWMQTSYAFIASYKQHILNLDRIIQNKVKPSPAQQQQPQQGQQNRNNTHVVEHRKLVQRFRQFLAEEEKFWNQLVVRLRRSFGLDEATPALVALGIINEVEEPHGPEASGAATHHGRNHFQFPPEDTSTTFAASSSQEREAWLAMVAKALISLGDINRYRELYNEGGGRPRAGHEEGPGRRGRNRRGGAVDAMPRPRNYDKAQHCYEQARLLVPSDGNPSHQLAILATYKKDSFMSITHYYRALCVRTPYDTALENLNSVLSKALEQWRNGRNGSRRNKPRTDGLPPAVQTELFKEEIVILHALWKVGMERGIKKMESLSRRHHKSVFDDFTAAVAERCLPTDMISNAIILSQSALWKQRMIRSPSTSRKAEVTPPPEGTSVAIEWHILEHILELHRALLEVGHNELKVPPPKDAPGNDLAQHITAAFRRTLPAHRIASKWMRANVKYLKPDHEFNAYQVTKRAEGVEISRNMEYQYSRTSTSTRQFWRSYAEFMTSLSCKFPVARLPSFTAPLEEDIEMRGFLPLKNLMGTVSETDGEGEKSLTGPQQAQEVHPNDWQLMRIADLLNDAKELVAIQNFPVMESHGVFRCKDEMFEPDRPSLKTNQNTEALAGPSNIRLPQDSPVENHAGNGEDDNMTEGTSRTDDDILREAFDVLRAPTEAEYEDEDDEIVWDPKAPVSPVITSTLPSPPSHAIATPVTHTVPLLRSPPKASPPKSVSSPFTSHSAVPSHGSTTAQDLLNEVMSGRVTRSHLESSAPPALLFASELSHPQGHNIWSASHEEKSLHFASQPNQTYQRHFGLDSSQSAWASSYPSGTQDSHHDLVGSMPSALHANQPQTIAPGPKVHQRIPSGSMVVGGAPRPYPNYHALGLQQDPFGYPAVVPPTQPPHRPDVQDLYGFRGGGEGGFSANPTNMNSVGLSSSPLVQNTGMYRQTRPAPYHQPSHSQQFSLDLLHEPRLAPPYYGASSMSQQIWGNVG